MTHRSTTNRTAVLLAALVALQGCAKKQENVFYDPWDQYTLGKVYDCGDIQVPDVRYNTMNAATPGFGCSHQSNLTLMVADPADLNTPREMTPADEQARLRVLKAYREGGNTSTAPDATGTTNLIE